MIYAAAIVLTVLKIVSVILGLFLIVKYFLKKQGKFPVKMFLLHFVLPYFLLRIGLEIFIIIGTILGAIGIPLLEPMTFLATFVPFASFVWLAWGFWRLNKIIR